MQNKNINILLFGLSGAGKSSIIKYITDNENAKVNLGMDQGTT